MKGSQTHADEREGASLTRTSECGLSKAGILSSGDKQCGEMTGEKGQPHRPQTA